MSTIGKAFAEMTARAIELTETGDNAVKGWILSMLPTPPKILSGGVYNGHLPLRHRVDLYQRFEGLINSATSTGLGETHFEAVAWIYIMDSVHDRMFSSYTDQFDEMSLQVRVSNLRQHAAYLKEGLNEEGILVGERFNDQDKAKALIGLDRIQTITDPPSVLADLKVTWRRKSYWSYMDQCKDLWSEFMLIDKSINESGIELSDSEEDWVCSLPSRFMAFNLF